ncbi:MAG: alpha-ketoglutarate-dependent dioxygenase AlkB family protein [Flavobacteriales bacterium]
MIKKNVNWKQNKITLFGKTHDEPRLTEWYGPSYSYSSISWPSQKLPIGLKPMVDSVERIANQKFNGFLFNCYRNGNDGMGWHRDNEKSINPCCIASLTFGETRTFKVRHRESKTTYNIPLKNGDLLLMNNMQTSFEHCLTKSKKQLGERINVTMRVML